MVQRLTEARLLVTASDRQSGQEYVEIIHDTLLREWKRLRRWLREEHRRYLAWRQEIEKRAQNWLGSNPDDPMQRDEGKLLRDRELVDVEEWLSKRDTDLSQLEPDLIDASREHEQQKATREEYRKALAETWTNEKLDQAEAERLSELANNKLKLSQSTTAKIEREIMGASKEAILERQNRLDELYAKARRSHRDQEWQAVVDLFDQIHAENPEYPDPEGLLVSAREELMAREELLRRLATLLRTREELLRRLATLYDQGQQHMEAEEWQQALERFEEVQRLKPGYRETERLLSQVRHELIRITPSNVNQIQLLHTLKHTSFVWSLAFSPDGRLLASGSADGTARLWRAEDGALLHTLKAHTGIVWSLAFSSDGRLLASGASDPAGVYDDTARLWRAEDGALLHTLETHVSWGGAWRSRRTGGCSPRARITTRRCGCGGWRTAPSFIRWRRTRPRCQAWRSRRTGGCSPRARMTRRRGCGG